MDTHKADNVSKSKRIQNQINLDDIDDEISFKPITKGLGFNSGEKPQLNHAPAKVFVTKPKTKTEFKNIDVPKVKVNNPRVNSSLVDSELAPFYQSAMESKAVPAETKKSAPVKKAAAVPAKIVYRLGAWSIDVAFVLLGFSLLVGSFIFAAKTQGINFKGIIYGEQVVIYMGVLFSVFYLLYFSILDSNISQTMGKKAIGIKLVNSSGEPPSFSQSLMASVLALSSLVLLGLPCLAGAVGKLTDTKVIETK